MAKQKTVVTPFDLGDLKFEKALDILSRMKTIRATLAEGGLGEQVIVELTCTLNALSEALHQEFQKEFNCTSVQVKDVLDNHAMDNSRVCLSINGTLYTYSKVLDTKVEVNKSYLSSLGYKSQNDLVNDYKSKGIPVPSEFIQETKQITKFVDTNWTSSSPFGVSINTTVIAVGNDVFKINK